MANKNITLHQKNNSGIYDNLYINTVATKLSNSASLDSELEMTDGNSDSSMNKIASNLKLLGIIHIRVVYEDSSPIQGIVISGLQEDKTTDENGDVYGKIGNTNIITLTSPYVDIKDKTVDLTNLYKTPFSILIIQMEHVANLDILRYETSKNVKFSRYVEAVDICCVGGGGGGGTTSYPNPVGGAGGGGGGIVNKYNLSVIPNYYYSIVIGAGGKGGYTTSSSTGAKVSGETGGTTSFMGVSAKGGSGGSVSYAGDAVIAGQPGVDGCGYGGNNNHGGSNTTVSEFDDGKTFYSGGGGAGIFETTQTGNRFKGGSPNGADGGVTISPITIIPPSVAGIGGGGGGASNDFANFTGGSGGSGLVAIRIHLKGETTT